MSRDMRKILSALCLFLFYAERNLGVSCSRFGHEPGAYNVPNLIPLESSEMSYIPTSNHNSPNRWYTSDVKLELIKDSNRCYSGNTCLKTVNRAEITENLFYRVSYDLFEPGYTYMFNVFIKLTSSAHDLVMTSARARSWYSKEPGKANYWFFTKTYHKVEDHWLLFSEDLKVTPKDKRDYSYVDFYVKVDNQTDFIIDAASLTKVDYPNWKKDAQENINAHRMGSMTFSFRTSRGLDPDKLRVEVTQKRRHFPFGFAVNAEVIGGDDGDEYVQRYRAWVEKRATWAVFINAAKWKPMEPNERDITNEKFKICDKALAWLDLNNITTRGHATHWNKYTSVPSWVSKQANRKGEIDRRTKYVVQHFKGRFQHWDVCNEFTVSRLYQNWLKREDVLEYLYSDVHKLDPDVKRFTNEWGNLQMRIHFSDTVNAILRLKERQLIDGIGLQAHLHPKENKLDMELIKRRLEIFTGLGIPVWITELTVKHSNPTIRGNLLADSLTLFYGTPGVHGILLWDFAPVNNEKMMDCALASPEAKNNAAGDKYDEILTSWSTNLVLRPSSGKSQLSKDLFYGTYDIKMFYDGVERAQLLNVELIPEHNNLHLFGKFRPTSFSLHT